MSFGGGTDYNRGINNLGGSSNLAMNSLFPAAFHGGQQNLQMGSTNTGQSGNYFNTLLNGNRANTTAMLQPDINRIQGAQQGTLQAASTLMPRGGGRSGTLFQLPFQGNSQIQSLFGGARSGAAGQLGQLGLGQGGLGANLFGQGTSALNSSNQANEAMSELALRQKQMSDQKVAGLANGLFSLLTTPFGGGAMKGTALGSIFGA
jgi:hypothetical protein